ncbi:hypothetical protein AW02_010610 [Bacillus velezensis NJN-6]|nr:hypothetical protein AW02_010610 [Bacillus velezensis NJN-6]MBB4872768.1 hypothetical protein [Bacillus velezensis]
MKIVTRATKKEAFYFSYFCYAHNKNMKEG